MKIIHVSWWGRIGGIEKYVSDLSINLKRKGHVVEICALSEKGCLYEKLENVGFKVHIIGMKNGCDLASANKLRSFLEKNPSDIIHVHDRNFLANYIITRYAKCPLIFTEHGGELIGDKHWKRKIFYALFRTRYKKI